MGVKKAIVLDLDNTLVSEVENERNGFTMFLRPGIDKVILKLQEAKKRGIDIILCTTARNVWVERFLTLRPEFRQLFTKLYTRDNTMEWRDVNFEEFPIESVLCEKSTTFKPVTTWGYDSVLFIDDSEVAGTQMEKIYGDSLPKRQNVSWMTRMLKELSTADLDGEESGTKYGSKEYLAKVIESLPKEISDNLPSKRVDTTFLQVPFYRLRPNMIRAIFSLKIDPEYHQKIKEYIEHANKEPGCGIICCEIDKFIEKEFAPGLTMTGEDYEQAVEEYEDRTWELESQFECPTYSSDVQDEIDSYMAKDREGPYLGILPEEIKIENAVQSLIRKPGVIEVIGKEPEIHNIGELQK